MKMMSTCRWCTPGGLGASDFLQEYCSGSLSAEDEQAANEDLFFCPRCMIEYHRARDKLPSLHKRLWELETARLLALFTEASEDELEEDDLLLVEDDQVIRVPKFNAAEYENLLRRPLIEMLTYPYLMGHPLLCEMFVEALCRLENSISFRFEEKCPGVYLLLVHPNETVRRWAIRTAGSLGNVDRDDFYDFQDIFNSMFSVIELDIFQDSDIDTSYDPEKIKMVGLPRHLYDSTNYKNYWLGICMLLTMLDAQALESLLLGADKQTDIIQCILNTMEKAVQDESMDPFWPALQCFMVILDGLGSKIWGLQIEPVSVFQAIIGSPSYTTEIENIRRETMTPKVKVERACDDDMVTCSQIIYESNVKEKIKHSSVRSSARAGSGSGIYERMQPLDDLLKLDIAKDMQVHNCTFLWFIPFVKSVMDLGEPGNRGNIYTGEIIHYLCGEIKDLINGRIQTCDKVTDFFIQILVRIINLHLEKSCMNMLFSTRLNWVEVIGKCAILPCAAFPKGLDSGSHSVSSTSSRKPLSQMPQVSPAVPQVCMTVIQSLLREGGKLTLHSRSIQFLDMLNKKLREVSLKEWSLSVTEVTQLRNCLMLMCEVLTQATNRTLVAPSPTIDNAEPRDTENCSRPLKSDQRLDSGQCSSKVIENSDHADMKMGKSDFFPVKKEPYVPEEHFESVSELKPGLQLTRMMPDPGKLEELKTKMSPSLFCVLQDIAKKHPDSRNVKVEVSSTGEQCTVETYIKKGPLNSISVCEEGPEDIRPSTSISERSGTGTHNAQYVSEGSEYGDDVPLSAVKGFLKKSQKFKCLETQTDFKVDRALNRLSVATSAEGHYCPLDSSPEVSGVTERMEQKRKNKGRITQGDHSQHLKIVEPALDVIVISDSESAKEDDDICDGRRKLDRFGKEKFNMKSEPLNDIDFQKSPGHGDLSEIDSQMFEFETQEDVFSAWSDHKISSNVPAQETKKEPPSVNEQLVSPGPSDPNNILGYETEPISDEIIENALLEVEQQLKKQKRSLEPQVSNAEKTDYFVKPKVLPNEASGKGSPYRKRKEKDSVKTTVFRSGEQSKTSYQETTSSKFASKLPCSSFATPAIVPPKKVRKPVEPTSAVEKLGLKKKERKAFILSQRSLDYVGKLRQHGQGVQVEQKKRTRRNKKSKVISPQKLTVKGHKKLLASQDLQFFRQSREKPQSLQTTATSEQAIAKQCPDQIRKTNSKWNDILKPNVTAEEEQDKDELDLLPLLLPDSEVNYSEGERRADRRSQESQSMTEISSIESKQSASATVHVDPLYCGGHSFQNNDFVDDAKKHTADEVDEDCDPGEDAEGDADMNLTQMEPVDMEMCSQMADDDDFFLTQRDPVDMEIEYESQISTEKSSWMDRLGQGQDKAITPQMGSVVQKPSTYQHEDDKLFLKPGMSPLSCRKAKPSTTKIYAPSSRSATLVQEMEKTTKPLAPATKNKFVRLVLPVRKSVPQPEFQQPHPVNRSVPIQISTIGSSPHVPSYKMYARPETPVNKVTHMDSGYKFDQSDLIKTILRWTYDMFCSYTQFGVPSDLCDLPLKEVANSYMSYKEYFETFYPLLLVNTFEELAKDWAKNTNSRQIITHNLTVIGIEYSSLIANANFTACLFDRDVQNQLYPKEDDLVILWLPQNRSMYTCNEPELMEPRACFGCVSRSNVFSTGESPTLNLTVQTRGNVSSVNNQAVKCQVVGSLVSTIREFRALYMLKNNTMFRPVLAPQVTFFQPDQENIFVRTLPEFNKEQVKAIKWGVSIVKRQQTTPKICLIHGPPGTGKSKTIAGLLQSLFSEENSAATVSRHSKASRLRVLLCAPSNAAIDSLMKKVIVVFKENCRNIQSPLGNCGDVNLVRLGMEKTISKNLKLFSLDNQTRVRTQKAQQGHGMDINRRKQLLDQDIDNLSQECAQKKNTVEFHKLTEQKYQLLREREQLGRQLKETRSRKHETQAKVLQDAHIICCTLSTSGSVVLESAFRRLGRQPFNCVIVDEAGQAAEPETLIPMQFRCPALILVGDPEQLPPTVVSQNAKEKKYDQSLMARLWKCLHRTVRENPGIDLPLVFLKKQYRMHPDICQFPSVHIYNRDLETDRDTAQNRCAVTWPFQPYRLFDVADGRETRDRESFCNHKEVKLVVILIKMILDRQMVKIGVITPYNAQKYRIQESINREMAKEDGKRLQVEVDTVDGFQGREMDCIIVSCVRASSESGSIGFLGNRQRMNVTITRAKYSLFILGHLRTLREQRDWGALIQDAGNRGTIIKTHEKDFKISAKQIFKPGSPESGLKRSLSYPPKEPGVPSLARSTAEAPAFMSSANSAGERAAPFRAHQALDRLQVGVAAQGKGSVTPPSRPLTAERPRDPRLAVLLPHPRQDGRVQKEQPHPSGFSLNRSMSREERPVEHQPSSREWGGRESHQAPSHTAWGPLKRPSDSYYTYTSTKKGKR